MATAKGLSGVFVSDLSPRRVWNQRISFLSRVLHYLFGGNLGAQIGTSSKYDVLKAILEIDICSHFGIRSLWRRYSAIKLTVFTSRLCHFQINVSSDNLDLPRIVHWNTDDISRVKAAEIGWNHVFCEHSINGETKSAKNRTLHKKLSVGFGDRPPLV